MRTTRLYPIVGIPALISMLGCSTGGDAPGQPAVVAPSITSQPAAQSIIAGQNASFSVTATGTSLRYQWRRSTDGGASFTDMAGAANATLALTAVPLADDGHQYRVMVSNSAGSVTSNAASLTVNPAPVIPAFTTQPANATVTAPSTATFNVVATGTPSPTLQWQLSTDAGSSFADIAGATANSYTTPTTSTADNGNQYRVIATNGSGAVTSTAATLTVNSAVVPKAWGTAAAIETGNDGDAADPQIAMDANGNGLAVWRQSDGTRNNIWANRYTHGTGWGTAALIETDNAGDADSPQVVFDAIGDALVVWRQSDGTHTSIWSKRYTAGTGWGAALLLEADNANDAHSPQIASTANGTAVVVWVQTNGSSYNTIRANRYTPGTGWGTAVAIDTDSAGYASDPQIAMDANGNAVAVWSKSDGTRFNIVANRYSVGTGWGTAALIETNNVGSAYGPQVALDTNGNALAVWVQFDGENNKIVANRYTNGSGWGTPTLIETGNAANAIAPQLAFDAGGNALAVWSQYNGTRYNIWSNRYTDGIGWGTAALIETDDAGHASDPQIAFDASGNALAVWRQSDGARTNILANGYTSGTGWGTAVLVESDNGSADKPQIASEADGNAMVVWPQHDGTRFNLWANRFQ